VAQLRSGPVSGDSHPPYGDGSLNLLVGGPTEKIAYGISESGKVANLDEVGFSIYTTGENVTKGGPDNLPNIQFEIDAHRSDFRFATLVFAPKGPLDLYKWTTIDATDPAKGFWYVTRGTQCTQSTPPCTFQQVKQLLPDAEIGTVMINKGRDFEWQGAVDGLGVNGRVADFEEGGVVIKNAQ